MPRTPMRNAKRAALQLKLAEAQQEAATSAAFLASWRLYADRTRSARESG